MSVSMGCGARKASAWSEKYWRIAALISTSSRPSEILLPISIAARRASCSFRSNIRDAALPTTLARSRKLGLGPYVLKSAFRLCHRAFYLPIGKLVELLQ